MPTVQLRTCRLRADHLEDWLDWWRNDAVPVRTRHGFTVLFGVLNQASNEFLWAVGIDADDKDFDERDAAYKASADHRELSARQPDCVESVHAARVRIILPPTGLAGP